jgi:hypothetical protein
LETGTSGSVLASGEAEMTLDQTGDQLRTLNGMIFPSKTYPKGFKVAKLQVTFKEFGECPNRLFSEQLGTI